MQLTPDINAITETTGHPVFIIEGVDGSGKSTIGPLVANSIGAVFYEYPRAFKPGLESIDKYASLRARYLFFLGYNVQVAEDIKALSNKNPVVCARYVYSTIAYHIAKGLDRNWAWSIVKEIPIMIPQRVFFLDVTEPHTQLARLKQRGLLPEDEIMVKRTEELRAIYLEMSNHIDGFEYIDTSCLTIGEVVNQITLSIINP